MISVIQKEKIQEYYDFFYLKNIKKIIKNEKIEYKFYNLEEMSNYFSFENFSFHRSINYNKDLFLENFSQNKISLAKDIIKNGTYWPFWGIKYNNKIYIIEGIHRFFSLYSLNQTEKINKKFLCFILPVSYFNYEKYDIELQQKKINVPCAYFYLNNSSFIDNFIPVNLFQVYRNILIFGMKLSDLIFKTNEKYPEYILPHPILNNEKLFEEFLKDESF